MDQGRRKRGVSAVASTRSDEEMWPSTEMGPARMNSSFAKKAHAGSFHPKKDDDAYVPSAVDWTSGVDDVAASDDSRRPLVGRRGNPKQTGTNPLSDAGGDGVGGTGHVVNAMAVRAIEEANKLGAERVVLMLLSAVTIITGLLCVLSAPTVFYNNHVFRAWKTHAPKTHRPPLPTPEDDDVLMPAIPLQILTLEHALWRFGLPAIALGAIGFLAVRVRRTAVLMYVFVLLSLLFSLACFLTIGAASSSHYLASGEQELSSGLKALWDRLVRLPNGTGHVALCDIQQAFACTGFSVCCLTNSTPIDDAELFSESGLPGKAWESLCFLTASNGTRIDRKGNNVTAQVNQQCAHMLTTGPAQFDDDGRAASGSGSQEGSTEENPTDKRASGDQPSTDDRAQGSVSPSLTLTNSFSAAAAVAGATVLRIARAAYAVDSDGTGESPLCPLATFLETHRAETLLSPCQEKLIGSLTTSLAFVLCALFALAVFSLLGVAFAVHLIRNGARRPAGLPTDRDNIAVVDVAYLPQATSKGTSSLSRDTGTPGLGETKAAEGNAAWRI